MKRAVIEKEIGETPLAALTKWKKEHSEYETLPASYAGRLDPMASGKLLMLFGDECRKQKRYTGLDKEYEIEVLLDVGSDTGDVLGVVSYADKETIPTESALAAALLKERGAHLVAYPVFSSKTVNGTPLFLHALTGTLGTIEIPKHIERFYRIEHRGTDAYARETLKKRIHDLLLRAPKTNESSKRLGEDFRIDAVRASWERAFGAAPARDFTVVRLRVVSGSGAYMRSLAGRIGETLGTKALALSIRRTKIGKYVSIGDRFGFWSRSY